MATQEPGILSDVTAFFTRKTPQQKLSEAEAAMNKESDPVKKAELKVDVSKAEVEVAKEAAASGPATSGTASMEGSGRRKRKGGKHTKRHTKKGGKSRRGRTGRKSSRL